MKLSVEPLALTLYRRHLNGESAQQIADNMGIPVERVEQRLRAAALFCAARGANGRMGMKYAVTARA